MSDRCFNFCHKARTYLCNRLFKAKVNNVFSYRELLDCKEYRVFKRLQGGKRIECAHEAVAVLSHKNKLFIYPDYRYPSVYYTVSLNTRHFPDLIPGSQLAYCRVLPYLRHVTHQTVTKAWRLMVVTDKGQIYHNYPSRHTDYDGNINMADIIRFEESVVWDLPGRRYPAQNRDCAAYERYYPNLPKEVYQYHPPLNQSDYGNGGFGATCSTEEGDRCRFYIARREPQGNPFYYMSGFSTDTKMAVLATYRGNLTVGVRTCIFASDDGGRQWFCQYEFGDLGEYKFQQGTSAWGRNFGNAIHCRDGLGGTMSLRKRTCILPTSVQKEPAESFSWAEPVSLSAECRAGVLVLASQTPHGYETGNIVTVSSAPEELDWMCNSEVNATSAGNGLLFKVEKHDEYTICLHEFVASPDNPISCRHIHHVNRVRDGWLIGTGEIYPNSWILYMQMKEADTYAVRHAKERFPIYRLNSSEKSVQRTLGVLWKDDENNTILYASDHDVLEEKTIFSPLENRSISLSRNATGIYRGRLCDIDDYNRFSLVFEAKEPAYLLQEYGGVIVFSGQRGELALSFDGGTHWRASHIDGPLNHHKGGTFQYQIFDDYLLQIK